MHWFIWLLTPKCFSVLLKWQLDIEPRDAVTVNMPISLRHTWFSWHILSLHSEWEVWNAALWLSYSHSTIYGIHISISDLSVKLCVLYIKSLQKNTIPSKHMQTIILHTHRQQKRELCFTSLTTTQFKARSSAWEVAWTVCFNHV